MEKQTEILLKRYAVLMSKETKTRILAKLTKNGLHTSSLRHLFGEGDTSPPRYCSSVRACNQQRYKTGIISND